MATKIAEVTIVTHCQPSSQISMNFPIDDSILSHNYANIAILFHVEDKSTDNGSIFICYLDQPITLLYAINVLHIALSHLEVFELQAD